MKKGTLITVIVCLAVVFLLHATSERVRAEPRFLTIGSGDFYGVYFPTGLTIVKMVNRKRDTHGIRATVESTAGSVFNLNAVLAGHLEFGMAQSDVQHQAVAGTGPWEEKGPQKNLRSVFSLHHESVCLVAAVDVGIQSLADLKGSRVNLGNPGSGEYRNAIEALEAAGLNPWRDVDVKTEKASVAPTLLFDNRIDAFFCTVGHPSEMLQMATSGERKIRFLPVTGSGIDRLVAENPYYTRTTVPVARWYSKAKNAQDVQTFGVIATLCTSSSVPDRVVYLLTKEVLDHFEALKKGHPALMGLEREDLLKGNTAPFHPGAIRCFKEAGLM